MPTQANGVESRDCRVSQQHDLQCCREDMVAILEVCLSRELIELGLCAYEYGLASGFYGRDSAVTVGWRSRLLREWRVARRTMGGDGRAITQFIKVVVRYGRASWTNGGNGVGLA